MFLLNFSLYKCIDVPVDVHSLKSSPISFVSSFIPFTDPAHLSTNIDRRRDSLPIPWPNVDCIGYSHWMYHRHQEIVDPFQLTDDEGEPSPPYHLFGATTNWFQVVLLNSLALRIVLGRMEGVDVWSGEGCDWSEFSCSDEFPLDEICCSIRFGWEESSSISK